MAITEIIINKKYRFTQQKAYFTLHEGEYLRAVLCSDGYTWCFEPGLHNTTWLEEAIMEFIELFNADQRKAFISSKFAKAVVQDGTSFERQCFLANGRRLYG
jgi:hypothetical protein